MRAGLGKVPAAAASAATVTVRDPAEGQSPAWLGEVLSGDDVQGQRPAWGFGRLQVTHIGGSLLLAVSLLSRSCGTPLSAHLQGMPLASEARTHLS